MILGDVVNAGESIASLLEMDIPAKISVDLAILSEDLKMELSVFNKRREEVFTKLGEPMKDSPNQLSIPPENAGEFSRLMNEILAVKLEERPYYRLSYSEVVTIPSCKGRWIFNLFPFMQKDGLPGTKKDEGVKKDEENTSIPK